MTVIRTGESEREGVFGDGVLERVVGGLGGMMSFRGGF